MQLPKILSNELIKIVAYLKNQSCDIMALHPMSSAIIFLPIPAISKLLDFEHGYIFIRKKRLSSMYAFSKKSSFDIKIKTSIKSIIHVEGK